MVREAERFADDDKNAREKVEAKNGLEQYAYALKQSLSDESLKGKLDDNDKTTIEEACASALRWIESNADASKEAFEEQKKKLEETCMPIMAKLAGGAGGMPDMGGMGGMGGHGGAPGAGAGPTVEEYDVD